MSSRRQLLGAVSAGLASTAGCLDSLSSDAQVRLCAVDVRNRLADAREVRLRVRSADRTVFADELTVAAGSRARLDLPGELPFESPIERPDALGVELSVEGLTSPTEVDLIEETTVGTTWLEPVFELSPEARILTDVRSATDC